MLEVVSAQLKIIHIYYPRHQPSKPNYHKNAQRNIATKTQNTINHNKELRVGGRESSLEDPSNLKEPSPSTMDSAMIMN